MSEQTWYLTRESVFWDSDKGFSYDLCQHRTSSACMRCRIRWFIHLWRNGNHVWRLP